jgi:hypothetical protein
MASLFPIALSDPSGLSPAPTTSGTIEVTDDYTLAAGDSLDIVDPTGFDITVTGIQFEIDGTVTVTSAEAAVTGVVTTEGDSGSLVMTIGASGSLIVTGSGDGAVVTGVQTEDFDADFVNRGSLQVLAAEGSAFGMVTHESESDLDNYGTLEVTARDQGFGIYIDSNTHSTNDGTIRVVAREAIGIEEIDEGGAVLWNDGMLLAIGKGPNGSAIGMLGVDGPDIFNTGTIRATAQGVAAGLVLHVKDSFSNDGSIIGVSRGADPSFGMVFDNGEVFNGGLIKGDIALAGSDIYDSYAGGSDPVSGDSFTNESGGRLLGKVMMGGGDDVLVNGSGVSIARIIGDIDLGEGNDSFASNHHGFIDGVVFGGLGNDRLTGSLYADTLFGDEFEDSAGGGNDRLCGVRGDDFMIGGQGRDILIGGAGADSLGGGAGDDVFVFARTSD